MLESTNMNNKTPQTIGEAVRKFLHMDMNTRIAIKRSYDDWTLRQMWADKKKKHLVNFQRIDVPGHARLGSDIAVSKFVLGYCGGRIRDQDERWIRHKKELPTKFEPSFKVTAIKARDCRLLTEGMDNFVGLESLEWLDIAQNPRLDDFSCDVLARIFRKSNTFRSIDISFNSLITIYGLEILLRIPSLRQITALGTRAAKHNEIDLFTLAAQDERQCEIFVHDEGRQFKLQELEELRLRKVVAPQQIL